MGLDKMQSVEPDVALWANGALLAYGLSPKLEQAPLNEEIDGALNDYFTKNGGAGGNRPDAKLLLRDASAQDWPILIEYKGHKDRLVKFAPDGTTVENRKNINEPNYKNINAYAVNGAIHYANAILHHTAYTDIIAIGVAGHKDETGHLHPLLGVYYVSKANYGIGQKVGDFADLSFLKPDHFPGFIARVKELSLPAEERDRLREQREREIDVILKRLNNDIYQHEKGLGENERIYLVAASIIATLGVPGRVAPLKKEELRSSTESGNTDGEIILRKIEAFLKEKNLPEEKSQYIRRTLTNTLTAANINKVIDGETQVKRVFVKIVDDLGIYYKIGLTTDFTGRLFNEMYNWLGFTQDKLNDVVLTPSYVATLLVRLARVNKDSYVWDFATGSAGLLVAAMNEMLDDAKRAIHSPEALRQKSLAIKAKQLLGIELLPSVHMLAILNMILMGDGSSHLLNKDSLRDFDGENFPANAFVLNPPYSAPGNGMIFVQKALSMMKHGYAAIIIQASSGNGKACDYNREILQHSTLLASIKMPADLFIGKSSVQTYIYVFQVGQPHHPDSLVRFIDFSDDGYTRTNRKKAAVNLRDTNNAKARYQEVVDIVRFGAQKRRLLPESALYEGSIDPTRGDDWNQTAPIETTPTLDDFQKTVSDYLAWKVATLLKQEDCLGK